MGARLVERHGMSVAIFNESVGASTIDAHLPAADPADLRTLHGRLLTRARAAGVADAVRAVFWYQGESDAFDQTDYAAAFDGLAASWRAEHPDLEQILRRSASLGHGRPQGFPGSGCRRGRRPGGRRAGLAGGRRSALLGLVRWPSRRRRLGDQRARCGNLSFDAPLLR